MVCSNLGPLMATSLDCWFLLHGCARLGACIARCFSADSTDSCSHPSLLPTGVTPTSLVADTFWVSLRGRGSLACSRFSPVPGPCFCKRVEVAKDRVAGLAARRLALAQHARTAGTKLAMADEGRSRMRGEGLRRGHSRFEQSNGAPQRGGANRRWPWLGGSCEGIDCATRLRQFHTRHLIPLRIHHLALVCERPYPSSLNLLDCKLALPAT